MPRQRTVRAAKMRTIAGWSGRAFGSNPALERSASRQNGPVPSSL